MSPYPCQTPRCTRTVPNAGQRYCCLTCRMHDRSGHPEGHTRKCDECAGLIPSRADGAYVIVRALAAVPAACFDDADWCSICGLRSRSDGHKPDCPWVLAQEWTRIYGW